MDLEDIMLGISVLATGIKQEQAWWQGPAMDRSQKA
jgi:hypothetical protein